MHIYLPEVGASLLTFSENIFFSRFLLQVKTLIINSRGQLNQKSYSLFDPKVQPNNSVEMEFYKKVLASVEPKPKS